MFTRYIILAQGWVEGVKKGPKVADTLSHTVRQ